VSFRVRITLIAAAAVAIAIALAALVTYNTTRRELLSEVDHSLQERMALFAAVQDQTSLEEALRGDADNDHGPLSRGDTGFDAVFYRFLPTDSPIALTNYSKTGGLPIGAAEQAVYDGTATSALRTVPVANDNLRMLTAAIPTGVVQVARSLAEVDSSLTGLAAVLKMAAIVGILLAAAVGYLVARDAARPIRALAAAAEHVAETQELAAHIDVHRTDEVGRLAESFNDMLAALDRSREQQRRLVHDAGHELRTPLTAIRTNIELLSRMDSIPDEERKQMIADIDSEIQELSGLVTELVDLAAEPPSAMDVPEEVNLGDVVDRVADKFRRRTENTINVVADESVVLGRAAMLERAVSNLIDNAVKWSPPDAPIDVTVRGGTVSVVDRGPGIDEEDRPFVFNRFYRATAARSTPGSGLGLSIVTKVAEDHGGQAFVGDSVSGAIVGFQIPLLEREQDEPPDTFDTA
jgi:two-component system sensor histidine kinase MprB